MVIRVSLCSKALEKLYGVIFYNFSLHKYSLSTFFTAEHSPPKNSLRKIECGEIHWEILSQHLTHAQTFTSEAENYNSVFKSIQYNGQTLNLQEVK